MKHLNYRLILSRLPLPMLALAAAYGVYSFAALYVPVPVAIIQATAFELTYIGLAVTRDLRADDRKRATAISVGAVCVSIIYNSLAGLFHRNPEWLTAMPWYAEVLGAVLHGAPLAWVAYLVADLLLHSGTPSTAIAPPAATSDPVVAQFGTKPVSLSQLSTATGTPLTTLRRKLAQTIHSQNHTEDNDHDSE